MRRERSQRRGGMPSGGVVSPADGRLAGGKRTLGAGTRLLKLLVILLCSINFGMWELYAESTIVALFWAGIALGFAYWIIDDMRR